MQLSFEKQLEQIHLLIMKFLNLFLIALGLVFFTGCSSSQVWTQTGKSPDECRRALAGCKAEASRASNPLAMVNVGFFMMDDMNQKSFIKNCMIAKGYDLVDKNTVAASKTTNGVAQSSEGSKSKF